MVLPRFLRYACLLACALPLALLGDSSTRFPPEYFIRHLPETNPYRAILHRLLSLPGEDQQALESWASPMPDEAPAAPLTEARQTLARELTEALARARSAPPTSAADWPLQTSLEEPDNLYTGIVPEINALRCLAGIATRTADSMPAGQAVEIYAAVAQLARQQRQGGLIIQQLTGMNIEETALSAAARRLDEMDADALRTLARSWSGLLPPADPRSCLENERDVGFTFFIEAMVRPALLEWLGPEGAGATAPQTPPPATFTRDLRLSGLIDPGDGEQLISLENVVTGERFTVSPSRPAQGIRLVHIDFPRREAIIRRGRREAVIHLESKQITERSFAPVREPARQLEAMMESVYPDWPARRAAWLERVRTHPGGVEGYLQEMSAANDRYYEQTFAAGALALEPAGPQPSRPEDPVLGFAIPTIGGVLRTLHGANTAPVLFQAAIHHRLGQLGQAPGSPAPADPWGESPDAGFTAEPSPEGGFLLRSRYELKHGRPLTYKFAAPDAGIVRQK